MYNLIEICKHCENSKEGLNHVDLLMIIFNTQVTYKCIYMSMYMYVCELKTEWRGYKAPLVQHIC